VAESLWWGDAALKIVEWLRRALKACANVAGTSGFTHMKIMTPNLLIRTFMILHLSSIFIPQKCALWFPKTYPHTLIRYSILISHPNSHSVRNFCYFCALSWLDSRLITQPSYHCRWAWLLPLIPQFPHGWCISSPSSSSRKSPFSRLPSRR
jgi:hypothetical protein